MDYKIPCGRVDLIDIFNQSFKSFFAHILCNFGQSQTLASLRDTLLPKLLSGEIRVKEAEREVEAAL